MSTMDELITRSFTPDLQVRSGGDGRTIYGIAVPYNRPTRIDAHLTEMFTRGAFKHQLRAASRVKFSREHVLLGGTLIGRADMLREDAAGLYGEFRVSKTPVGDETLELVRDGALTDLSITFREHANGNRRMRDGTVNRVKADVVEVAVVLEGAYGDLATASGVRSHQDSGCAECGCTCAGGEQARSAGSSNLDQARQLLAQLPVLSV
jgi:HK97 family phage prohead protease